LTPCLGFMVLVGDAELEEGSNAEAIQFAGRVGLDRLTTVVIDNDSAGRGWPGGIAARFAIEGWATVDVDGRDHGVAAAQAQRVPVLRHKLRCHSGASASRFHRLADEPGNHNPKQ